MATLALTATACVADAAAQTAFLPGVAVDPQHTHAFSPGMAGRLIAVDLADGRIDWRSHRPLEALGFAEGSVIALSRVEHCVHYLQLGRRF